MKKIRVMHVLNTGSYSGAENVAISIIKLTEPYCDSMYVSLDGSIRDVLKSKEIDFYPIKKVTVSSIREAISQFKPDVIHAHDFTTGIICALTMTKIPIVNHIHNNSPWLKKYGLRSFVYRIAALRFKYILTVSPSVMEEYVFGKRLMSKVTVIGNPVDTSKVRKLSGELIDNKQYDIGFLGRLTLAKNPMLFLDIVNLLKEKKPGLKCIMIGDGEMRDEVKRQIQTLNLEDNIDMVGFQKNPYKLLKQAKVCCMPSKWEGFGLAAVESLSLGIPVVASPVGGLVTIIDNTCGYFCVDSEDYCEKILKLIYDEKLYQQFSKGAFERADKMDNIKEYTNQIIDNYKVITKH